MLQGERRSGGLRRSGCPRVHACQGIAHGCNNITLAHRMGEGRGKGTLSFALASGLESILDACNGTGCMLPVRG